jgi:hypothetical protein
LVGAKSLQEMQERIAARAAQAGPGEWITGRGWDHTLWPGAPLPSRQDIDAVTAGHPAYFTRVDGHIIVANSAALQAAGITAATPAPEGGAIDHAPGGEPTGILRETARDLVAARCPQPGPEQRRRAIGLALAEAARWGITSLQDNSRWEDFLIYEDLEREGKLTARISEWLPFEEPLDTLQTHRARHPQTDPLLRTGMLKGFMDGSLGSRTAALLAPYADDPGNSGLPRYSQAELNTLTDERAAARFQIGFHAIGDAGVGMALDAFAEAGRYLREEAPGNAEARPSRPQSPGLAMRFRIEHAQVVTLQQIRRFCELGVIASMQPSHVLTDMHWAGARLGATRARYSYAWKAFLDAGVPLAFGTDYPIEAISPFRGLYAAVTRRDESGASEYFPEEKITLEQAIAAYTTGAAYAEFAERDKGLLRPGMLADFVVLDRDLTKIPAREVLAARVLRTVMGGKTVYESK